MSSYIAAYLLLFLPIIASVFCFLINFKKTDFWIFVGTILAMLFLVVKLSLDFAGLQAVIKNDAGLGILSIPTEYYLDFLALFFIGLVLTARLALTFFYHQDVAQALNNDNRQLFYTTSLLNLFGLVGIFATNNIFNLFIFIEIYCLTFCAIMAMSNDLNLSKLTFQYFCQSALASIMLLLALVLLYVFSGELKIDEIKNLTIIENSDLIFWLVATAIMLKFFPLTIYFRFLKSQDLMAHFLISFTFIISGLVGFYLLLKMVLFLFHPSDIFFNGLVFIGFILVFYGNYKMFKTNYVRAVAAYFAVINVGLVLIAIGFFTQRALTVSLIYITNYLFSSALIFLLASLMYKDFSSSHFRHLSKIKEIGLSKRIIILITIILILNPPIALMFWSNWHLALLAFDFNIGILSIIPLVITNLVMARMVIKLLDHQS
ncbi:MAG: proton-conducting transporter membrane subunit [Pseudomonadota bacterium]